MIQITGLSFLQLLQLLILPVILPMLVGLVSTRVTQAGRKSLLLLALSVVTSFLTTLAQALESGASFNLTYALLSSLVTFVLGVGIHYGLLKPTGTTSRLLDSGRTITLEPTSVTDQPIK